MLEQFSDLACGIKWCSDEHQSIKGVSIGLEHAQADCAVISSLQPSIRMFMRIRKAGAAHYDLTVRK